MIVFQSLFPVITWHETALVNTLISHVFHRKLSCLCTKPYTKPQNVLWQCICSVQAKSLLEDALSTNSRSLLIHRRTLFSHGVASMLPELQTK